MCQVFFLPPIILFLSFFLSFYTETVHLTGPRFITSFCTVLETTLRAILFIPEIEKQNLFTYPLLCQYGVMLSFEKPIYLNGYFLGFEGWDSLNQQFGSSNISFIVRVEFELSTFKENRIKRRFKLFWSVLYKYFGCFY